MRTCLLQTHSKVNEDLYQLTLPNHAAYCGRHEYDMVQINCSYKEFLLDLLDHVEKQLVIHDQVLTVGSDIIFTAPEIPLSAFDTGTHGVFMGEEGLGSSPVNFDLVLWTRRPGTFEIIRRLRQLRPHYENHSWGPAGRRLHHDRPARDAGAPLRVSGPRHAVGPVPGSARNLAARRLQPALRRHVEHQQVRGLQAVPRDRYRALAAGRRQQ